MRIGQDINMQTNIAEGYAILEYKKRDLYNKGQFNTNGIARFIRHYPDYIKAEMVKHSGSIVDMRLMVDTTISANEVFEQYKHHQSGIDSFTGEKDRTVPANEYELLNLAADLDQYCGLY